MRWTKGGECAKCSPEHNQQHFIIMARAPKEPSAEPNTSKIAEARARNLDLAIQQIQKDYGEGAILRMGTGEKAEVSVIPTGNLLIDQALGVGGFARGRIVEIYGPESSGKTTLTLTAIAQAQKAGGLAAFIDVEHALDPNYAKRLGVKMDELLVSQPSSGEEALRICETLVRSNALDVIVIDSVAALVTRQELDGEIGDSTVGAQARLMSAALRKLTAIISKARTCCIFTNQIREKIGVMFGNPETTPGGKALKFYASVRVDIRRIGAIKSSDGTVTGNRTKVKIVKNKLAPPYTEAEFDIMYNEGISNVGSMLDLAMEFDILQKRGSWISYKGTQLAQGRDAAKETLKNDPGLYAEIEEAVKARLAEKGGAASGSGGASSGGEE
jgi:recombination protein RecA